MRRRIPESQTIRARGLRSNATDQERTLWRLLSRYRSKFTRQLPIGPYIADLACRRAKLVIEIDGSRHLECDQDLKRTAFLEHEGWTVIRFWNTEVIENPEGVAEAILLKAAECLGGTHPQPLPYREGRPRQLRSEDRV